MSKKSDLPVAPAHLKSSGARLWVVVVEDYQLEGADLTVLESACTHFDRATSAREIIDAEGAIIRDRFNQAKPHPACDIEQAATRLYLAALRQLGLGLPPSATELRLPQPTGKTSRD